MSTHGEGKNVYALRTFAQDASRLRNVKKSEKEVVLPIEEVQEQPVVQNEEPAEQEAPQTITEQPRKESRPRLTQTAHRTTVIPKKDSFTTDSSESFDMESGDSGSIIRDTKRKRFKLLPAMVQASTEWFQNQKTAYTDYRHPHHTIEKSDVRKEVIEAAVGKSAIAPKEDFHVVAEHLREVERKPVTSTVILKDKTEVPKPQWSYVEEPAPVEEVIEAQEEPILPPPQEARVVEEEVLVPSPTETETIPERVPEPNVDDVPVLDPLPESTYKEELEEPAPVQKEIYHPPVPQQAEAPVYAAPQRFPSYLLVSVIVGAILLGVGASYYLFTDRDTPQEKIVVYKIPSLIAANAQYPFTLPNDRNELLLTLREALSSNATVIQLYAAHVQEDGAQKPASAEEILQALAPRTGGSFNRAITELTFGGVGTEPYIIMKVTSFDTAFAGMLDWEKTMSADLSPLFGTPVVTTFDPGARTDTQLREAFFKDTIASNKNVRLLLDEEGNDRIIYTFINQNTVLITTTRDALEVLVPLIK